MGTSVTVRRLRLLFVSYGAALAFLLPWNVPQLSAAGMDPAELKREFGRHVTFWGGGCETQTVLHHGKPEEVARMVKERIETFAPGGGYVFNQIHNVMANIPAENVIAMFDAAYRYGRYSGQC